MPRKNKAVRDPDLRKGAVEEHQPRRRSQSSLRGQLPHREHDPLIKDHDSGIPEPGQNPEHTGQLSGAQLPEVKEVRERQASGDRRKRTRNDRREDPLPS